MTSPPHLCLVLAAATLGAVASSGCKCASSGACGGGGVLGSPAVTLLDAQSFEPNPCELDLDFGNIPLGSSGSAVAQIVNNGAGPLDLSTINPSLDPAFVVDDDLQPLLEPGTVGRFTVTFQPSKTGFVTSAFTIPTDGINPNCPAPSGASPGDAITVKLVGNGIQISLVAQPNVLDFGSTFIGATATKSFSLINKSPSAVNGITATVSGGDAKLFVVQNAPATLGPGDSATVSISYSPVELETRSLAGVQFQGDDGEMTTLNLFGEPVDVALSVAPTTIDFGFVPVMTTVVGCTTVSNQANVAVTITGVNSFSDEGGAFAEATTDDAVPPNPYAFPSVANPLTIDAGDSAEVCFQLTPPTPEQYNGTVTLTTTDPSGVNPTLTLTGWGGGPQIKCMPASVDFGQTAAGTIATVAVICTNVGVASPGTHLILEPPTASPSVFSAQFDQVKDIYPLNGLAPGENAQIDVSYAPTTTPTDQGTLTIKSNGGKGQPVQIPLSGQGLGMPP